MTATLDFGTSFSDAVEHAVETALARRGTPDASPRWTRERFWSAPPETQIDSAELAEALGLSRGAIQRRVNQHGMPCRRVKDGSEHGTFVFIVGDVREWEIERQEIVNTFTPRAARPRSLK
jgi:hypothetical protein